LEKELEENEALERRRRRRGGVKNHYHHRHYHHRFFSASAAHSRHGLDDFVDSPPRLPKNLRDWWKRSAKIDKKTIASLGSACLLSYGFVSNLFYVSSLLIATYTSIKATGQSPVTSSESLKIFASSYFGLWMIQNVIRPARFAFSVAISPKTDKLVEFFQKYVPGNKKSYAFGLTVFSVNVVGTIAYMFGGFALIYALTGVPLDVGKLFGAAVAAKKGGGVVA